MWYNNRMSKMIEFPSGLKVVLISNFSVRSLAIGIFVKAGAEYEKPSESGISHFIEHMVFKGTATRSAFDIANETDGIGANINAYTAKGNTCFYTTSLAEHGEECIDVLSDMYFNPKFDAEDLENERNVVYEEINECEDDPSDVCYEILLSNYFKGHPLGKPILGTKRSLAKMTSEDLFDYMHRRYTPENTVISMAGNITEEECVRLVEKYFESRMTKSARKKDKYVSHELKSCAVTKKKRITQSHIAIAFPCYEVGDDRGYYAGLLSSIFASEMSSRLFQSVREKLGLCYTISGSATSIEKNGAYIIYTATSPENAVKAVGAIKREIEILLADGVTDEEMSRAKEQMKTALVLGQESTSANMRVYGRVACMQNRLYDMDYVLKIIGDATKEDLARTARDIFDFSKVAVSHVSCNVDQDLLAVLKS